MDKKPMFRVWDKNNKKFILPNIYSDNLPMINLFGEFCSSDKSINSKDFIIQENTGIKDIYLNEIYEGDIIKADTEYGESSIFQCIWHDQGCFFCFKSKNLIQDIHQYFWFIQLNKIRLIGNIFEDSHLL